jgi:arylsulfatase A-like enzyme
VHYSTSELAIAYPAHHFVPQETAWKSYRQDSIMKRCSIEIGHLAALFLCLFFGVRMASAAEAGRPNVIVFLADDAGWGDYSINGNAQVQTPSIDSLARQGVELERFYVCSVCSPTRAEFLSGRYHPRTGVYGVSMGQERMDPRERTIADAFQAAGYATACFGKWHNGSQWPYHPMARGFDQYFGHTSGHWGEYFDAPLERNGQMERSSGYIVDACTNEALKFIRQHSEKPFFCFIPFTTPHSPWAVPKEFWQRHQDQPITQGATLADLENQDHTRCALAMIENQDWNVSRILDLLDQLKLADNTIVVYFSDNGPNSHRFNGGMKGYKGSTDEGGLRSACFIRWPAQLPAGRTVPQIAGAIDLLPTLVSLAGVPRAGQLPLDGRDLSALLLGSSVEWPDRFIFSHWAGKISLRTQHHRLDHQGKLFDMRTDPGQTKDVSSAQPELAGSLRQAVKEWMVEMSLEKPLSLQQRRSVDPRPFDVGYPEFPITMLPARDGQPHGSVRRSSAAPNCSYFVDWTSLEDRLVWNVRVETSGDYRVVIDYTCPLPDAGSVVELAFRGDRLVGRVQPGWDPPLNSNQDTLPRPPAESQMKEFKPLDLGIIRLEAGSGELSLRALEIPGGSVMDLRRLTLTLQ